MSHPNQDFTSLSGLIRSPLGDILAPGAETLLEMVTDDVSFAPPDGTGQIIGRSQLAAYLPTVGQLFAIEQLTFHRAIVSVDGQHAVLEFSGKAYANATGARYDQAYVSVLDLRSGLVSRHRDYWNPLIVLAAAGADKVNAILRSGKIGE